MTRLKEIRKSLRLSQEQMAGLLDVSRKTYGRYERGDRIPGPRVQKKLANLLHIPPGMLLQENAPLPILPRSSEEESLLAHYRKLDPDGKAYIFQAVLSEESLTELYRDRRRPFGR